MVIIPRKENESIVISDIITITVIEVKRDKVRLGIVHPKGIPVHCQEVYEAIHGRDSVRPIAETNG
jgi:carbon storage regulator